MVDRGRKTAKTSEMEEDSKSRKFHRKWKCKKGLEGVSDGVNGPRSGTGEGL